MSIIIYGPQACGKTRNAENFRKFYELDNVVDGAEWPTTKKDVAAFKSTNDLWLVSDDRVNLHISGVVGNDRRVIHFNDAIKEMAEWLVNQIDMSEPGYEKLAYELQRAYDQAARGKGKERHAQVNEPFHTQVMADGAKRFGVGSLLFQAYKKAEESQRLPFDRALAELHGAMVYLAGAAIELRRLEALKLKAEDGQA